MVKFIKRLTFLIIVFVLAILIFKFCESEFFYVTKIEITGANELIRQDITNKIDKFKGISIFYVNKRELSSKIIEDIRIEKVNISKKYPRTLNVEIVTRQPIAFTIINDKFYSVDKNLNVFGKFVEVINRSIPVIRFDDETKDEFIKILKEFIPSDMYNITSEIAKEDNHYILILDTGVKVLFNKDIKKDKFNKAFKIYNEEMKINNLEYIDLRFKYINVK